MIGICPRCGREHAERSECRVPIPIVNKRKLKMKKLMVVLGCAAMVALVVEDTE